MDFELVHFRPSFPTPWIANLRSRNPTPTNSFGASFSILYFPSILFLAPISHFSHSEHKNFLQICICSLPQFSSNPNFFLSNFLATMCSACPLSYKFPFSPFPLNSKQIRWIHKTQPGSCFHLFFSHQNIGNWRWWRCLAAMAFFGTSSGVKCNGRNFFSNWFGGIRSPIRALLLSREGRGKT